MFENTPSKTGAAPEDIFSGVDEASPSPVPATPPQVPAPTNKPLVAPSLDKPLPPGLGGHEDMSLPPMPPSAVSAKQGRISARVWIFVMVVVVVIVIAAALAAWMLRVRAPIVPPQRQESVVDVTTPLEELLPTPVDEEVPVEIAPEDASVPETAATASSTVDTDRDGLTDEEETRLGTATRSADTDNDGLSDADEIKTWGTNPLNPDTDGDTYLDGVEVQNGFNPKGSGALLPLTP